jgi:hypothetical protein
MKVLLFLTPSFILIVVGTIDGAHEELDDPSSGGQIDPLTGHFVLFDFESACAIDHGADVSVGVEFSEEVSGLQVVTDLGELEGDCAWAESGVCEFCLGVLDDLEDCAAVFTGWVAVGDGDDEDGFVHLAGLGGAEDHWVDDLVSQGRAQRGEAVESDLGDQLEGLLFGSNAVAGVLVVHAADLDAVGVEQGAGEGGSLQDELEVVDSLAVFFKRHGPGVIDKEHNVVQRQPDQVDGQLHWDSPMLRDLRHLRADGAGQLLQSLWWVERLQLVLLHGALQNLHVVCGLRAALLRWRLWLSLLLLRWHWHWLAPLLSVRRVATVLLRRIATGLLGRIATGLLRRIATLLGRIATLLRRIAPLLRRIAMLVRNWRRRLGIAALLGRVATLRLLRWIALLLLGRIATLLLWRIAPLLLGGRCRLLSGRCLLLSAWLWLGRRRLALWRHLALRGREFTSKTHF